MRALIDTCVVVDYLQKRIPFADNALRIFQYMSMKQFDGFITAKSATDIFYLSHKYNHSNEESRMILHKLLSVVGLLDTTAADIQYALLSDISDFEDAVMAETANRSKMDCVITRNIKHFRNGDTLVYEPQEFLDILEKSI